MGGRNSTQAKCSTFGPPAITAPFDQLFSTSHNTHTAENMSLNNNVQRTNMDKVPRCVHQATKDQSCESYN